MSRWVLVEDVEILFATERAIRFQWGELIDWVPRSQVRDGYGEFERGEIADLEISEWWLEKKGYEMMGEGPAPKEPDFDIEDRLQLGSRIYRRLAAKYHPDRSPDTAEFMKDLNELWQAIVGDLKGKKK